MFERRPRLRFVLAMLCVMPSYTSCPLVHALRAIHKRAHIPGSSSLCLCLGLCLCLCSVSLSLSLSASLSLSRSLVLVLGSLGGAAGAAFVVPGELALSMRTESGQCTRKDPCGPSCQVFAWPETDRQFHRLEMQGARSSDSTGHAHFGRKATSSATPTAALVSQRLPP